MTVKDRTGEFFAAVQSLQSRNDGPMLSGQLMNRMGNNPAETRRLLEPRLNTGGADTMPKKSDFARAAAAIGREIYTTSSKLDKLTKCKL
jgi:hypothetical protein